MKAITMLILIIICLNYNLKSQVTIGSEEAPVKGALLQLKERPGIGVNSDRGLGLPLVKLLANTSLEPCVLDNISNQDESVKAQHAGLVVYNVGAEVLTSIEDRLCKGAHVWSGHKWIPLFPYPEIADEFAIVQCQPGPDYTLSCSDTKVLGMYSHAMSLNSSHYITVKIIAPASSIGKKFVMKAYSPDRNDISFSAEGIINSTEQIVHLQGTGTVSTVSDTDFKIITNSKSKYSCSALVRGTIPPLRIVGVGSEYYNPASKNNLSRSYKLMSNTAAFGNTETSVVRTQGFTFEYYNTARTANQWIALFESKPDIIIRTYHLPLVNTTQVKAALNAYLAAGGVYLEFNDNNGTSNTAVEALYGASVTSGSTAGVPGDLFLIENVDDELVNGVWGNLAGRSWAEDASYTQGVANIDESKIVVYSRATYLSKNYIVAFRDKTLNYVYIGDGGFMSGAAAGTLCCYPFQLDGNNMPKHDITSWGTRSNSVFFANIMTWAIKQAAKNGINTRN